MQNNDWKSDVKWNRRHWEFVKDNGCFQCEMFPECNLKCGNEGFICPIENPRTDTYQKWLLSNYSDLCSVITEPSKTEWESVHKLEDTSKLKFKVSLPYIRNLKTFIGTKRIDKSTPLEYGFNVICEFTGTDLRKRLVALRRFERENKTSSDVLADALEDLLIPHEKQLLFKPLKIRNKMEGELTDAFFEQN